MTDIKVTSGPDRLGPVPSDRSRRGAGPRSAAWAGSVFLLIGACVAAYYEIGIMHYMVCDTGACDPGARVSIDRWTVESLAIYGVTLCAPFAVAGLLLLWARGRSRLGRFRILPTIAVLSVGWLLLAALIVGFVPASSSW